MDFRFGSAGFAALHELHSCLFQQPTHTYGSILWQEEQCTVLLRISGPLESHHSGIDCITYRPHFGSRRPNHHVARLRLAKIPYDADIVSVAAICGEASVLAVAFVQKGTDGAMQAFLNLYSSSKPIRYWTDSSAGVDYQQIPLKYTPYLMRSTRIRLLRGGYTRAFVIAGSDCSMHFVELSQEADRAEGEASGPLSDQVNANFFPEFENLPSSVLSMDNMTVAPGVHLCVLGCQDGYVVLSVCRTRTDSNGGMPVVERRHVVQFKGPVSCVKFFRHSTRGNFDEADLHLVVTCMVECAAVYRSVLKHGLAYAQILPMSTQHDSVCSVLVADLNWDGYNELVIGTYGSQILAYSADFDWLSEPPTHRDCNFSLKWQRGFTFPVYSLHYADVTGDGMRELIVSTMYGTHFLQHDIGAALAACRQSLQKLTGQEAESGSASPRASPEHGPLATSPERTPSAADADAGRLFPDDDSLSGSDGDADP
eukprot:m.47955 g.47955  ORF g.47955 m.47955 type:complete len:483 (+) comp14910_c0_seq3:57-1505(+)